jgi:hypothetical protein
VKFLLAVAYLIAFSTALSGQLMTPEQVIRRTLHSGISEGHDQKIIGTMGDAAAVTLIKVLGGTVLTSQDMDLSLVVLSSSFAGPGRSGGCVRSGAESHALASAILRRCRQKPATEIASR